MYVSEETLMRLDELSSACDVAPWVAIVEGRDQMSGDSFIQTANGAGEDIYVTRDSGPADQSYLDLIAGAVTQLPELIREIRERRASS